MLSEFDLGYAASWIRNSSKPSPRATVMWISIFNDSLKAKWLIDNSREFSAKVRAKIMLRNYTYDDFQKIEV
ncbi:MAG: hypothetical protein NDF55_04630 [archaeon GB-1867-005]|nr:hypothetical protein [Candidatus Culexmicrobium cathedralense]